MMVIDIYKLLTKTAAQKEKENALRYCYTIIVCGLYWDWD